MKPDPGGDHYYVGCLGQTHVSTFSSSSVTAGKILFFLNAVFKKSEHTLQKEVTLQEWTLSPWPMDL